ncbi:MAG: hypothetical protein DRP29_08235 [Thermodesulfobacteriota bacterium]|nr:MAG: hypothetical protein DRP29_08235 [Thermodesulfobacteriota bacterium]
MDELDQKLTSIVNKELAEKSKSAGEILREAYERIPSDINLILEFNVFDNQRKDEYLAAFKSIQKIKDPAKKAEAFARFYENIKTSLLYALGVSDPRLERDLEPEERIKRAIELGAQHFYY